MPWIFWSGEATTFALQTREATSCALHSKSLCAELLNRLYDFPHALVRFPGQTGQRLLYSVMSRAMNEILSLNTAGDTALKPMKPLLVVFPQANLQPKFFNWTEPLVLLWKLLALPTYPSAWLLLRCTASKNFLQPFWSDGVRWHSQQWMCVHSLCWVRGEGVYSQFPM